jgi:ATP-dependent helicase/nuclease subunit A
MVPAARLARRVALEISEMIGSQTTKQGDKVRPLEAGDFLVLVRNRNSFVDLLVRALKVHGVPVAGADRMHLLGQIAVMDLMAFARFLLLPEDDLSLAELLRSPLIGLSEEELFALCAERTGRLWPRLRAMAGKRPWAANAAERLQDWLAKAGRMTPHELFADLLGRGQGRHLLYRRLGPQCGEAIDEFLGLALLHEKLHAPTLQGFLAWVMAGDMVVKRDLEAPSGQVRIMTVHGAKGLQAPVVFLCDQRRSPKPPSGLFWIEAAGRHLPLWSPNSKADGAKAAELRRQTRDREIEEENRLLYVAMTRAEERLIVCGWTGARASGDKSWHDHVGDALAAMRSAGGTIEAIDFATGQGWKGEALRHSGGRTVGAGSSAGPARKPVAIPGWLHRTAPAPALGSRALAPSRVGLAEVAALSPLGTDEGWRFKRGRLVHHLLELLPSLEAGARAGAGRAYLASAVHGLEAAMVEDILAETLAVIENPAFDRLFGKGSAAEVPIIARWRDEIQGHIVLSGRIDRLWVGETEVWAVDFKSNRPAPLRVEHVSDEYRAQMAAYRVALQNLHTDKVIRCFLLWTDGPRLMELPSDMLPLHASPAAP